MQSHSSPLISIVIAVYNGVETLQQCIDSVTQQTYKNVELIVIDGASTDGTVELLNENSKYLNYWMSEPDRGIYNAWNKGLKNVTGEWVCFLGADDYFYDAQALERIVDALVLIPVNIRVAYGQIALLNNRGEELYRVGEAWKELKKRFKQIMCIPHPAVMHRHSLFVENGNFDESMRIAGDYEFLLRELKSNDAWFIPDVVLTAMRQGGVSTDPASTLLGLWEVRLAQRKNGDHWPGSAWVFGLMRAYLRKLLWNFLGESAARRILDVGRRIMGLPPYWTKT